MEGAIFSAGHVQLQPCANELLRLLCPALFSQPWTWSAAFSHIQQPSAVKLERKGHASQHLQHGTQAGFQRQGPECRQPSRQLYSLATRQGFWPGPNKAALSAALQLSSCSAVTLGGRGFSSSSQSSLTEAATAAAELPPTVPSHGHHSITSSMAGPQSVLPSHLEMSDTLTLAACIRRFRSRGHLVSQLDPLHRTPGGPWLGPIGDAYTR